MAIYEWVDGLPAIVNDADKWVDGLPYFYFYSSAATPPTEDYTNFITIVGSPTSWVWNSGQYNVDYSPRAASSNPTVWKWAKISSSTSYFYPSGSPSKWVWVSGSSYS